MVTLADKHSGNSEELKQKKRRKLGVKVTREKPSCLTSRTLLNKSNGHAEPSE